MLLSFIRICWCNIVIPINIRVVLLWKCIVTLLWCHITDNIVPWLTRTGWCNISVTVVFYCFDGDVTLVVTLCYITVIHGYSSYSSWCNNITVFF